MFLSHSFIKPGHFVSATIIAINSICIFLDWKSHAQIFFIGFIVFVSPRGFLL